jgi:hypothetical protein
MTGIQPNTPPTSPAAASLDHCATIDDVSPHMSIDPAADSRAKNFWTLGLCAALLVLFATLSYSAVLTKNATYDEPLHAAAGAVIHDFGDYRIDPEDPAFFTWLSSVPHASGAVKIDTKSNEFVAVPKVHDQQWFVAINTLYRTPGNDPDTYINRSRFLFMLIGLACGAMVCWWAWKLAGRVGAFAATACYALDPNFIGHASLVKNDVPLALVTVGLMFALWRAGRRLTWWNLLAICVALAAAINVKFSGPIFFFIAFLSLLARAMMSEPWPVLIWDIRSRLLRSAVPLAVCFVASVFAYTSIWACYEFRYAPTKDTSIHFDFDAILTRYKTNIWQINNQDRKFPGLTPQQVDAQIQSELKQIPTPLTANVVSWAEQHKLLPEAWLDGFFFTYATTRMRGSFLNGYYSITGWWFFFPLCVLLKTPTAVLVAGAMALVAPILISLRRGVRTWDILSGLALLLLVMKLTMWAFGAQHSGNFNAGWNATILVLIVARLMPILITRVPHAEWWDAICLIVPVLIYGGMAMASNFNLGIRHVLPLLPFLHLAVGIIVSRMLWRWGKVGAVLAAGLGMSLAIESCSAWPNYIAFLNAPAGGWRGGVYKLSDSNLDWGQDLLLLADWQKAHPEKLLYLCYFGTADPDYYKIKRIDLPGGYVLASQVGWPQAPGILAFSATDLQGTYMGKEMREQYAPLRKLEPREILGGTIYLFDWPLRPPTTQH